MSIKTDIVRALRSPACAGISFKLGHIQIHGTDYVRVTGKIESGAIQIVQVMSDTSGLARYSWKHATVLVGPSITPSQVIHEATHAAQDIHAKPWKFYDAELAAYVAQAIFRLLSPSSLTNTPISTRPSLERAALLPCPLSKTGQTDALRNAATEIARRLLTKTAVHQHDVERLRIAIKAHQVYSTARRAVRFDGLRNDKYYTTSQLQQMGGALVP